MTNNPVKVPTLVIFGCDPVCKVPVKLVDVKELTFIISFVFMSKFPFVISTKLFSYKVKEESPVVFLKTNVSLPSLTRLLNSVSPVEFCFI